VAQLKNPHVKQLYPDIHGKRYETPLWFDENGTPRYMRFHPSLVPNPYQLVVFLATVICSKCNAKFTVQSGDNYNHDNIIPYGTPPAHKCPGDYKNCIPQGQPEVWIWKDSQWIQVTKEMVA